MKKLKMIVGLSGLEYCLSPKDECHFPDDEADRLVAAGFAEEVVDDAEAERIAAEQAAAEKAAAEKAAAEKTQQGEADQTDTTTSTAKKPAAKKTAKK